MELLSKKRNQSKKAITDYTKHGLDDIYYKLPVQERKDFLKEINKYSDGKIFIEVNSFNKLIYSMNFQLA